MELTGPLDPWALSLAKSLAFAALPDGLYIERLYLHWSVESWGWNQLGYYNYVIDLAGDHFVVKDSTPPALNANDYPLPDGYAAHTWKRNSHAAGLAINGMNGATPSDFGPQPLQLHGVEVLCAAAAAACLAFTIDPQGLTSGASPHANEETIWTHSEAATADGYYAASVPQPSDGDTRWDLARLAPSSAPLTIAEAQATGALLRGRIAAYYDALAAARGSLH